MLRDPNNPQPQPLDPSQYEEGYKARMRGESMTIFSDWTDASWRAGWTDAGKELAANLDQQLEPKPTSPLDLKGIQ